MVGVIRGGIKPLEMEAFKHRVKPLQKLRGYRPRWRADDPVELITMTVKNPYPYIIDMEYEGRNHRQLSTSMTWAEAAILNRMTQEELFEEVKLMQREKGLPYYKSPTDEEKPRKTKIDRKKYVPMVMKYREIGMTFSQIASILEISASSVGNIWHEAIQNKEHS